MTRLVCAAALFLLPIGCSHTHAAYHEAKADYHHERAHEDLEHGHPVGAVKHKIKEHHEEREAEEHY